MPIFNCAKCGVIENTATGFYWNRHHVEDYDWTGMEEFKGKPLCSECAPTHYADGNRTRYGKWHGKFEKEFRQLTKEETSWMPKTEIK